MPINGDLLGYQRRSLQIGEIRIGTSEPIPGKKGRKPVRLDTFRFTTSSEHTAHEVARIYGGTVEPWEQRKGRWQVITNRTSLKVWVPPRDLAVDANMELWDGPRRLRKCNGTTEQLSGKPCMCPRPDNPCDLADVQRARDERARLAALRPPQACKVLTRINVTIPELPGLTGVFKLNTGSENAAVETQDAGDAMTFAREGGVYLPGELRIEWRARAADGKPYPVPVLQIGQSMEELARGALPAGTSGLLAQLQSAEPASQPKALTAGTTQEPRTEPPAEVKPPETAQEIADLARQAATREQVRAAWRRGDKLDVLSDLVCTDQAQDEWQELKEFLGALSDALPDDRKPAAETVAPAEPAGDALFDEGSWPEEAQR